MSQIFMFEKPIGFQDTLPEIYELKSKIRALISTEIVKWGYRFIETPTLEYYETVGKASAIDNQQLLKLLDAQGQTLVMRPDMTTPIARIAASKLLKGKFPIRLAYSENVFRAQQNEGRLAEFEQIGVELIGDHSISADGEVIALVLSVLKEARVKDFTISIGHIGLLKEFLTQLLGHETQVHSCMKLLFEKNLVGYREYIQGLTLPNKNKESLMKLLECKGDYEAIQRLKLIAENDYSRELINQLETLWETLKDYKEVESIHFDLTLVSQMNYYTGILFEIYSDKIGFPIGNGGRYDQLFQKFGREIEATGFALRLDRLVESVEYKSSNMTTECILFDAEHRQEAFGLAKQRRDLGRKVILQDIQGVNDIEAFSKLFKEVILLINRREEV